MTRDEITRIGMESGMAYLSLISEESMQQVERFVALVEEYEREACVKDVSNALYGQVGCGKAIEAIRARGQTKSEPETLSPAEHRRRTNAPWNDKASY